MVVLVTGFGVFVMVGWAMLEGLVTVYGGSAVAVEVKTEVFVTAVEDYMSSVGNTGEGNAGTH